jgi:protein-disulfide isomerase
LKDYGDRIRFVWHDLPLPMHPDAPLAAQAAREAYAQRGSSAFWAMHDKMFAHQQNLKRDDLDGYARELNLNMEKWNSGLLNVGHSAEIAADQDAGRDDGITAIPAFIIVAHNASRGYFVNGAQSYDKFRRLIKRALAESK